MGIDGEVYGNNVVPLREQYDDSRVDEIALEISNLQGSAGGDVEKRDPARMAELLRQRLVFFIRNSKEEIIASAYLEPFPGSKNNMYIVGGLFSKEKGAMTRRLGELVNLMEKHRDKTLFARTNPKIAHIFLVPMGFREVPEDEFNFRFKEPYTRYMNTQIPDFQLTKGVHTYIRENAAK